MYEKLIKALLWCEFGWSARTCDNCEYSKTDCQLLLSDAAAAIEALQAEIRESMQKCAECGDRMVEPKRGEWIVDGMYTYNLRELNGKAYEPVYRCSCCNRQMESYLRLDEPKMPEDADFPEYCPHCGAKMEVQE